MLCLSTQWLVPCLSLTALKLKIEETTVVVYSPGYSHDMIFIKDQRNDMVTTAKLLTSNSRKFKKLYKAHLIACQSGNIRSV